MGPYEYIFVYIGRSMYIFEIFEMGAHVNVCFGQVLNEWKQLAISYRSKCVQCIYAS